MTDLMVLVPSRGRPQNITRLIGACATTCRAATMLHFGFDDDDPSLQDNIEALDREAGATTEPRMGLVAWTNYLAKANLDVPFLASLGDDMLPVTDGWDERLITTLQARGPGIAYPNDLRRSDVAEAPVISTEIVAALGWFFPPCFEHWYGDTALSGLAREAGCLWYEQDVIVKHLHPNVTGEDGDQTYYDAAGRYSRDLAAFQRWRLMSMHRDLRALRGVLRAEEPAV